MKRTLYILYLYEVEQKTEILPGENGPCKNIHHFTAMHKLRALKPAFLLLWVSILGGLLFEVGYCEQILTFPWVTISSGFV